MRVVFDCSHYVTNHSTHAWSNIDTNGCPLRVSIGVPDSSPVHGTHACSIDIAIGSSHSPTIRYTDSNADPSTHPCTHSQSDYGTDLWVFWTSRSQ